MRSNRPLVVIAVVAVMVISVPAAAFAGGVGLGLSDQSDEAAATDDPGNEPVDRAPTGQQLATVLRVTDDELSAEVESAFFESSLAGANESERADILAARASILRDRARAVIEERDASTNAYEAGNLTRTTFAQRLAVATAQASSIDRLFAQLNGHADGVSALELRTAGFNRSANHEVRERLDELIGPGTMGLLSQFTGERMGAFTLELNGGVSIAVETDDGERSREFERPQPGDGTFSINASEAVDVARSALDGDLNGTWRLDSVERDDDGYYEVEFGFGGPNVTGEAEVDVDGATGELFSFEEELEPRDEENADDDRLEISIIGGEPEAGSTVTLAVTDDGEPVEGAIVEVDGGPTAVTNPAGRVTVTLPTGDETVEIEAEADGREGELELSVRGNESGDDELRRNLTVDANYDNGSVTLVITYEGSGVPGLMAYVDETRVGPTGPDGSIRFAMSESDDVDVTLIRGALTIEVDLELENGQLRIDELELDGRDDDDDDEDDQEDEDEEEQDDDDEQDDGDEDDQDDEDN